MSSFVCWIRGNHGRLLIAGAMTVTLGRVSSKQKKEGLCVQFMDKRTFLDQTTQRMAKLQELMDRDAGGALYGINEVYREVKYWKECAERGIFDVKENEGIDEFLGPTDVSK